MRSSKRSLAKKDSVKRTTSKDDFKTFESDLSKFSSETSASKDTILFRVFNPMPFKGNYTPLSTCHQIMQNETIFLCHDCSINDRAYLCMRCFGDGGHESHRFSVFLNNNS